MEVDCQVVQMCHPTYIVLLPQYGVSFITSCMVKVEPEASNRWNPSNIKQPEGQHLEKHPFCRFGNKKALAFLKMALTKLNIPVKKMVWKWGGRPCILSIMHPCMVFKISSRGENHQNAPNDLWPTFGNISYIECGVIKCYHGIWLEMQKSITNAVDNDISSHVQVEKEPETPSLWRSSVERLLIAALQWSVCWCNWLLYFIWLVQYSITNYNV